MVEGSVGASGVADVFSSFMGDGGGIRNCVCSFVVFSGDVEEEGVVAC